MKIIKILFAISFLILLSSCVNLAKRFRGYDTKFVHDNDAKKYVIVNAASYKISIPEPAKESPQPPKDFFSLSEKAQVEFIKTIAGKAVTDGVPVDSLVERLKRKLSFQPNDPQVPKVKFFPFTIKKSVVFSVDRQWAYSDPTKERKTAAFRRIGDRIDNLELKVKFSSGVTNFEFNSWDKFVNDKVTVDLGKISASQNWNVTGELSANSSSKITGSQKATTNNDRGSTTGEAGIDQTQQTLSNGNGSELNNGVESNTSIGPKVTAGISDKVETSLDLKLSRLKLSGYLSKTEMTIRQEGAVGDDLSGNTAISLDLTFKGNYAAPINVFTCKNLYDPSGLPNPIGSVKIERSLWFFPDVTAAINGEIYYKFLYRHVARVSARQIPEARQYAVYKYGEVGYPAKNATSNPTAFELANPSDFKPITYAISTVGGTNYVTYNNLPMHFESANDAGNFLRYLILSSNVPAGITNYTVGTSYSVIKVQQ